MSSQDLQAVIILVFQIAIAVLSGAVTANLSDKQQAAFYRSLIVTAITGLSSLFCLFVLLCPDQWTMRTARALFIIAGISTLNIALWEMVEFRTQAMPESPGSFCLASFALCIPSAMLNVQSFRLASMEIRMMTDCTNKVKTQATRQIGLQNTANFN